MASELDNHWEVLAEAVQTLLRKSGKQGAYEQLKTLTQGQSINAASMAEFVGGLKISKDDKETLLSLAPKSYVGIASKLVNLI